MRFFRPILPVLALMTSSALGHSVEVNLKATLRTDSSAKTFTIRASSPDGYPINQAKIEAMLIKDDGTTIRIPLKEFGSQGDYASLAPNAKPGPYMLLVRDTTFPSEALEVQKPVVWPLEDSVSFVLPASSQGSIGWPLLVVLAGAPVVLALAFLAFIMIRKPKHPEVNA
jgi:hypothetical protein